MVGQRPAAIGLAVLAAFIVYGSSGALAGAEPRAVELPGMSLPDIAQNILLYVPFGTLGVWSMRGILPARRRLFVAVLVVAFVFSATMEFLQMLLASRIASPLDVFANVAGSFAGMMAAEAVERALQQVKDVAERAGLVTARWRYVLLGTATAILLTAWYPFDVTLDVSTLAARSRAVRLDPWLWPSTIDLLTQGARFLVLSAVLLVCLPRWRWSAAPLAILFAAAVDVGQLAMGHQPVGVAAFASQSAGAVAGVTVALFVTRVRGTWYAAA